MKFNPMPVFPAGFRDRFLARLVETESGCLEWSGRIRNAYGRVRLGKQEYAAHRIAWWLSHGDIPDSRVLDHLCRNKKCANVAHLQIVTQSENIRRGLGGIRHLTKVCARGHALVGSNVAPSTHGALLCRTCREAYMTAYKQRARSQRIA
jgi:hypothetical protein